jgi:hydrogenase expression/formation protein HypE
VIHEAEVPLEPAVEAACELLGLDPLGLANEGRFVLYLDPQEAEEAVAIMRRFQPSARPIGEVEGRGLRLETALGVRRPLEPGRGETLPRIC